MTASRKQILVLVVIFIAIAAILTVGIHMALRSNALGHDYLFIWHAGRALFLEGISPYSLDVSHRIQTGFYGRPAAPGEYPHSFPYPMPILLVPLPLYLLSYDWSHAAWMALNLLVVVSAALYCFPRAPKWLTLTLPLFYQMTFTLIMGNYACLIGAVLLVMIHETFFTRRMRGWIEFLGGSALAWTTNKPQIVWLFVLLVLMAAIKRRRMHLIFGFASGLILFNLLAFLLLPDWPAQWLDSIRMYPLETAHMVGLAGTLAGYLGSFLSPMNPQILAFLMVTIVVAFTAWLFGRWWRGLLADLLLISWCGFVISLLGITSLTYDQLVLLLPFYLWAAMQPPSKATMITWLGAFALSYGLLAVSLTGVLPSAVDRGPLLVYAVWLAVVWIRPSHVPRALLDTLPQSERSG